MPSPTANQLANRQDYPPVAALDLGTNNCRLLVARPEPGGFRVIDAFSRIVRLGEGVSATGHLSERAMSRTIDALRICSGKLRRWRVNHIRSVATEACRRADNCEEFLERVRRQTGIEIEIISSEEEASLALAGCSPLLDRAHRDAIVFDIGGGSTEVSWIEVVNEGLRQKAWISLPLGVVTLTEKYGGDQIGETIYDSMAQEVADQLSVFEGEHRISAKMSNGRFQMLGTSGTVTTLSGIHMGLDRYDRNVVDGSRLSFDDIKSISAHLANLDYNGRAAIPCIGRDRADLVVAGCAILEGIRRIWPTDGLRVADRGVREGILIALSTGQSPLLNRMTEAAVADLGAVGTETDRQKGENDMRKSKRRRGRRGGRKRRSRASSNAVGAP